MQKRKLGKTVLELTAAGLGTWAIGGPWQYGWGKQDDRDSIDTIIEAMETGINWIDAAPIYGCGNGESVIGQALRQLVKKPFIATKCGLRWNDKLEKINNLDPDSIKKECEESLSRLGTDFIDLYQLHWPVPDEQIEKAWEAMAWCVEQKMVRFLGACNCTVEQLARLQKVYPVAAAQSPYSILNRGIEYQLLDYCGKNGIGVVCYGTMEKGLLTGKFTPEYLKTLPADDYRAFRDPNFQGEKFTRSLAIVEKLRVIAAECGMPVSQLAIAWVLRRPEVTSAIIGARKSGQISQTAFAADRTLDAEILKEVEEVLKKYT